MIHKFVFDGTRLVLDVNSGSLHVVDDLVWDLLDDHGKLSPSDQAASVCRRYPAGAVDEAVAEIDSLVEKGALFAPDPFPDGYSPPVDTVVKALCLHLAHDCNLSCRYCFAGQGRFGGKPGLMPPEVGKRALDFLVSSSGPRRHIEVDFFGGEPLLNFGVLKELAEYGLDLARQADKEIKFTVTTNAVRLTREIGEYLNHFGISVVLSIDGREKVHDAMRPFPGGGGSHKVVLKNIRTFLEARGYRDYVLRGTFTSANPDFAKDVEYLAGQGFYNISMEPVVAEPAESYSLSEEMLPLIRSEYDRLTRFVLESKRRNRPVSFFHFDIDLDHGPCLPKRMTGCGAGYQYLAVDPEGGLYPCHQFAGLDQFKMGDVFSGVWNTELGSVFKDNHIYAREECAGCWARHFCSGGCHASAFFSNNDIKRPYSLGCELAKKRIECALYLKAAPA